ncbi:MAG: DUF4230 domain-containing protein [Lachnospiraceae bacterium]|jgi:hypothetical protein|nr:DUF4230 domain-containing protein [Lachnospiraceae bacterium]
MEGTKDDSATEKKQTPKEKTKGVKSAIGKFQITLVLVLLILVVAIVFAGIFFTHSKTTTEIGGGMTPQSIKEISQLATLEYRYKDLISITQEEEFKLFGLWDIDPGKYILVIQYDGIIKLGIDCGDIEFTEYPPEIEGGKTKVEIKLPQAIIISSETPMDSFEVLVDTGVFTKKSVDYSVYFEEAARRQEQYNTDILKDEMATTARENAKTQLKTILGSVSEINENYELVWID